MVLMVMEIMVPCALGGHLHSVGIGGNRGGCGDGGSETEEVLLVLVTYLHTEMFSIISKNTSATLPYPGEDSKHIRLYLTSLAYSGHRRRVLMNDRFRIPAEHTCVARLTPASLTGPSYH